MSVTRVLTTVLVSALLGITAAESQGAPRDANLRRAVEETARQLFALGATPGLGIVVVRDSQTVFAGGFGYANLETRQPFTATTPFYIASTTKAFTGLAAAILEQQGKWNLDAPLSRYLPGLVLQKPLSPNSITIRDLLTHTHGVTNSGPVVVKLAYTGDYKGNEELTRLLREHAPAPMGRAFVYGNIGYNIAGLAMDAVTRSTWKRTLRELIFEPLRMTRTTAYASEVDTIVMAQPYRATPGGFDRRRRSKVDATMQSAGGLFSTPDDMGRWLQVHINDGRNAGQQLIPAAAIRESHKRLAVVYATDSAIRFTAYGLGWQIGLLGNETILMHGGGFPGYATQMSFMPNRREGVVVMANNSEYGGRFASLVTRALYTVLKTGRPLPTDSITSFREELDRLRAQRMEHLNERAARSQVLRFPLEAYTGSFDNPIYGRIIVTKVENHLEARFGNAVSSLEVYDASRNQLRDELFGGGSVMTFTVKAGRATAVNHSGVNYKRVR